MIIRNATENDAEAIAALHAESWRSNYRNYLSEEYLEKDVYRERLVVWRERFSKPSQKSMFVLVAKPENEMWNKLDFQLAAATIANQGNRKTMRTGKTSRANQSLLPG